MDKKRRLKGKRESNENMNNKQTNKKKKRYAKVSVEDEKNTRACANTYMTVVERKNIENKRRKKWSVIRESIAEGAFSLSSLQKLHTSVGPNLA